jgi:CelD/BcsL family acetyltransferase involved in cellulose biosynthesis
VVVIDDPCDVEEWVEPWDSLAEAAGRPFCSPAWMLSWWHCEAPPARLHAIFVVDGDELIGVAPMLADRIYSGLTRYRLLASHRGTPNEPMSRPGREADVAAAIAEHLNDIVPRPHLVRFDGATPEWPQRLWVAWPAGRRPTFLRDRRAFAPTIDLLDRTFNDWFSARSRKFQAQIRRSERRLSHHGFTARIATTPEEVARGLRALERFHLQRWAPRGGSRVWSPTTAAFLHRVEEQLRGSGRFRLIVVDDGVRAISAHLSIGAGRHLSCWLGSFDEQWAAYRPGLLALVAAFRDASDRGYARIDLGQGEHSYKLRLADDRQELVWTTFVRPGLAGIRTWMYLAPSRGVRALVARLPQNVRDRAPGRIRAPAWMR